MRKHKTVIFIALAVVLAAGAALGAVAIAQADDQPAAAIASANATSIWDRIASVLKQNTGVTVSGADLQKASEQAHQQLRDEGLDNMLKKLVADGKITQKQADDYKTWLKSRPDTIISDPYKNWLESKPEGVPFGPGGRMPAMPRLGGFRMPCR